MKKERHDCAADGCTRQVAWDMLMCKEHWYNVPPSIRRRVTEAWFAMGRSANVNTVRGYREARDAAVASLKVPA